MEDPSAGRHLFVYGRDAFRVDPVQGMPVLRGLNEKWVFRNVFDDDGVLDVLGGDDGYFEPLEPTSSCASGGKIGVTRRQARSVDATDVLGVREPRLVGREGNFKIPLHPPPVIRALVFAGPGLLQGTS